ncbi:MULTISPECIES: hypothetical protein [Pseudobacillus]|uniref:hypothetical protein n=1 Tax=Pseudobacillus TaxID=108525 RepID=UPI00387A6930
MMTSKTPVEPYFFQLSLEAERAGHYIAVKDIKSHYYSVKERYGEERANKALLSSLREMKKIRKEEKGEKIS